MRAHFKIPFCLLTIAALAVAQGRISDKDLQSLMGNLKDDAKSFKSAFTSALKKSTIRKTSREKDAANLGNNLEKQTEAMHNQFKKSKKADGELAQVRATAGQIDELVGTLNLGPQVNSRWQKIQTELQQISSAFGIQNSSYENPRGVTPYPTDPNGPACDRAVGPERAKRLVEECLAVSTATRPPCNAQNSCPLIIDEIKRGCTVIEARNAPSFCNEYR